MAYCPAFDPFGQEVLDDPFRAYAANRSTCPVGHYSDRAPGFYTAFRYDDVVSIVMNRDLWTAKYGLSPRFQRGVGFNNDGAEHLMFRRAVLSAMSAQKIQDLESVVADLVRVCVANLLATGPGDFHDAVASPLPVSVIARLLGVEATEHEFSMFKGLSDELMAVGMNDGDPAVFLEVVDRLDSFWEQHLSPRRAALEGVDEVGPYLLGDVVPDDLISALLVFRDDDGRELSDFEISNSLMNLLLAGNETTTSLLTNLIWRLLEDRTRWEAVRADRTLVDVAIEESLRFDAPVLGMFRTSTQDVELAGVSIPAKSKIMAAYGSANRDAEIFTDPDSFRLDRAPDQLRRHIAFGKGAHVCPGASLSRMEARLVLNELLDQVPTLRLDGPSDRILPFNFWGRRRLPVAW